jgi:hypothetical protein
MPWVSYETSCAVPGYETADPPSETWSYDDLAKHLASLLDRDLTATQLSKSLVEAYRMCGLPASVAKRRDEDVYRIVVNPSDNGFWVYVELDHHAYNPGKHTCVALHARNPRGIHPTDWRAMYWRDSPDPVTLPTAWATQKYFYWTDSHGHDHLMPTTMSSNGGINSVNDETPIPNTFSVEGSVNRLVWIAKRSREKKESFDRTFPRTLK